MKDKYTKASPSFKKAISDQIELIFASPDFDATPQQVAVLKFVVNHTLAGKGGEIKDYTVATGVFGRRPNYDPKNDPVVSIRVEILRRALKRYYQNSGKSSPIRIDIPKDSYMPVFKKRKQPGT
jgi:hypothetical protein